MAQPKKAKKAKIDTKLAIAIVAVLAVALVILLFMPQGAVQGTECWKCGNLLEIQASELKDAITSVGKSDVNSKTTVSIAALSCNNGITLEKPAECSNICPNHPTTCWTITAKRSCGSEKSAVAQCIDISGLTQIAGTLSFPPGTASVTIEKTGTDTITVTAA